MTRSDTLIDETYRFEKGEYWKPILDYGRSMRGTYMVSNYGNIIHRYRSGIYKVTPYRTASMKKKGIRKLIFKVGGKEMNVARVVYEAFYGRIPEGYSVYHVNGMWNDNRIVNLKVATKSELGRMTGGRSRSMSIYDIDGDCYYLSSREAEKHTYMSRTTISDLCNGKRKRRPERMFVWEKDMINLARMILGLYWPKRKSLAERLVPVLNMMTDNDKDRLVNEWHNIYWDEGSHSYECEIRRWWSQ